VIPSELRQAVGLEPGDAVVAWVEDDRLVLRPRRAVEEEVWAMFEGVEGSLAAKLIQERRQEAQRKARG
jgi:AbrB family looped-hinge helix DNA binding protein